MAGTGYTSISDYLAANQGTVANEQAALAGAVNAQTDAAKAASDSVLSGVAPGGDPTAAAGYEDARAQDNAAQDAANSLGSQGGIAGLLQKQYGQPGYSSDAAYWDAGLLGGSPAFQAAQDKAAGLGTYLDTHQGTNQGAPARHPPGPSHDLPEPQDPGQTPQERFPWKFGGGY